MLTDRQDPILDLLAASERFVVRRALGRGSCGVVFEAFDRERGGDVAIKVFDPDLAADPRFRERLRRLASVSHPGLVQVNELVVVGERTCGVLELLSGPDLVTAWTQAKPARGARAPASPAGHAPGAGAEPGGGGLRSGLAQAAKALARLHAGGLCHGALKPSNALLDHQGNVRLLDFGWRDVLLLLRAPSGGDWSASVFDAPEGGAHPAADLYGLGALLYLALTGLHPGPGSRHPAERRRDVPADLDALCAELLDPDPARRPEAGAVGARVVVGSASARAPGLPVLPVAEGDTLVGREAELERLHAGLARARGGAGSLLWLRGPSGVGKSALVSAFIERARGEGALALIGRSYRHETVPFKVTRDLVHQLAGHLTGLPAAQRAACRAAVPALEAAALVRLFPELAQVEGFAPADPEPALGEPARVRRLGFAAVRALVARVASLVPTVLFCDDLQWGDADSAALFAELVRPPMPPCFVLAGYRSLDIELSPFLQALSLGVLGTGDELVLRDLPEQDARALAYRWLRAALPEAEARAAALVLARGSSGNPLYLGTLARFVVRSGGLSATDEFPRTLHGFIEQELAALPAEAQGVLELVAVAERPLARDVLAGAAELESGKRLSVADLERALALLESEGLVRIEGSAPWPWIDVAHDRIRFAVVSGMAGAQRDRWRRALVGSLERLPPGRSESAAVLEHFRALHDQRAAGYALEAGERALDQLAFDRAARLFKLALAIGGPRVDEGVARARLGDALRLLGRGAEAAGEYLEAVRRGGALGRVVALQLQAAEQLLVSGHTVRGLRVLRHVFRSLALGEPDSTRRARPLSLVRRLRGLRGFPFAPIAEEQIAPETLLRIDALWAGASGLRPFDPSTAEQLQAEHLVLALRTGEARRVARALALEVFSSAAAGTRAAGRTERLLQRATRLAEQQGDPESLARAALAAVVAALGIGDWHKAVRIARQAEALFRERSGSLVWERSTNQDLLLQGWNGLGAFSAIAESLPGMLADAGARDDRYAQGLLGIWQARVRLVEDRPLEALEALREIEQRFTLAPYWFPRLNAQLVECEIGLYRQDPEVWELLSDLDRQRPVRVLRVQQAHIRYRALRVRAAMLRARLRRPAQRSPLLRIIERDLRAIERERAPWGDDLARALRAGLLVGAGRGEEALSAFRQVEHNSRARHVVVLADICRYRQGELLGGEQGATLCAAAADALRAAGVAAPELLCDLFAPRLQPE